MVLDDAGIPNLHQLRTAIDSAQAADIVLFLFDLPFLDDSDLRALPLRARRQVLEQLLGGRESAQLRLSQTLDAAPGQLRSAACEMGLEGVMAKKADAPYVPGRSTTWLKLKCQQRQEFMVRGFTERAARHGHADALGTAAHAVGRGALDDCHGARLSAPARERSMERLLEHPPNHDPGPQAAEMSRA